MIYLSEVYDSKALILGISTYEADVFPKLEYVIKMLIHKESKYKETSHRISNIQLGSLVTKKITELLRNSKFRVIDVILIKGKVGDEDISRISKALHKMLT